MEYRQLVFEHVLVVPCYSSQCWMCKVLDEEGLSLYVVRSFIFPLFLRTRILSLLQRHVLLSLVCHMRWPESRSVDVPCYWLNVVPMYYLSGDMVCFVQHLGTILTVGDDVRASLPIAIQHSHLVLSSRVPISMLSTMLAAVELTMPRMTSFLHRVFPSAPNQ
jgi:hypothetical protein